MSGFRHFKAKAVLAAVILLLADHFLVLQKCEDSTEESLRISGDSIEYFRMAEGDGSAPAPFKYRPLAPFLVSLLPLEVSTGFVTVSYLALFLFLVFYAASERRLLLFGTAAAALMSRYWRRPSPLGRLTLLFEFDVLYLKETRRRESGGTGIRAGFRIQ